MTLDELPGALNEQREKLLTEIKGRILLNAATAMKGEMVDRIFNGGKDSNGSKIGNYSKKPEYYTREQFVRKGSFKPQGKEAKGKFKNGNPRKSMYLKGGYGEFRDIQGRQSAFVDAKLSGSLMFSIATYRAEDGAIIGINEARESGKRKGIEQHFGKSIFTPAQSDVAVFNEAMKAEIEAIKSEL